MLQTRVPLPSYLSLSDRDAELDKYVGIFGSIPWKTRINKMRKQFKPESSVFVGQLNNATSFFFSVVAWLCGGPSGPNAVLATNFPDFLVLQMESKYEDHPWKFIVLNYVMSRVDSVWDHVGPVPWDAVAEAILLSTHFSHCSVRTCAPPSNVLHRESISVPRKTDDARDLVSKRPYHLIQCLSEIHFDLSNLPIVEDPDRFVMSIYVHFMSDGTEELLVSYRLPVPQNFYGMEQVYPLLRGKRINVNYNDAIGIEEFYKGQSPKTYTVSNVSYEDTTPVTWQRRLFPVTRIDVPPLRTISRNMGEHAPDVRKLTYLDVLPHQLNTVAWMISHSNVPLWQWLGTMCRNTYVCPNVHRHSTVHISRRPTDIYGGCVISAPNTGKTLCVLLYICMSPRKCLIVTSKSMVNTWRDQAQRFLITRDRIHVCTHEMAPEIASEYEEVIYDSVKSLNTRSRTFHGLVNMPQTYRWVIQAGDDIKPLMRLLHLDAAVPGISLTLFQNQSLEGYICRRQLCIEFYPEQCLTVSNDQQEIIYVPHSKEWDRTLSLQMEFTSAIFGSKMRCKWDALYSCLHDHRIPSHSLVTSNSSDAVVYYRDSNELPCEPAFPNVSYSCPICTTDLCIKQIQCGHMICANCFDKMENNKCPICRTDMLYVGLPFKGINDIRGHLYEAAASYVRARKSRKWLVIGRPEIVSFLVQKGLPVLMVPDEGHEIVSSARRKDGIIYVWNKHPEGVYLGAFTDILFCNRDRRYYQQIGKGSGVRLQYIFFRKSIQDFMYRYNVDKCTKAVIHDWASE